MQQATFQIACTAKKGPPDATEGLFFHSTSSHPINAVQTSFKSVRLIQTSFGAYFSKSKIRCNTTKKGWQALHWRLQTTK